MLRTEKPKASVIVATYNRCKDLERCLNSLMQQTFKAFEIIVIDNGSTDNTANLLRKYPVKVIRDEKRNLFYIYNIGWRHASADIVVYFSDDSEAPPNWLKDCFEIFEKSKDIGALAGPVIATGKQQILTMYKLAMHSKILRPFARVYQNVILEGKLFDIATLCDSGAYSIGSSLSASAEIKNPIYIDIFGNNNVVIRKSVIEEIGGFDENFLFMHGDGDFFIRLRRAGYKLLFSPNIPVWHHVSQCGPTRIAYYIGRDYALFYLKDIHPKTITGKLRLILNIFYFNAFWLFEFFHTKNHNQLSGIKGFLDGVKYYFLSARKHYPTKRS